MIQLKVAVSGTGVFTYEKKKLKAVLRKAGQEVAAIARKNIRQSAGGGRIYNGPGGSAAKYRGGYEPGKHQASAPGNAPSSITGTLANSIKVKPFKSGEGVAIRDTAFYSVFLEYGAKGGGRRGAAGAARRGTAGAGKSRVLAPRPFLTTALAARSGDIAGRVQEAILQDVAFRKMKA